MIRTAIFASGSGSNAEAIMELAKNNLQLKVALIISNNPQAGVLKRAEKFGVPTSILSNEEAKNGELLNALLEKYAIKLVVLAGYLRLIPEEVIKTYTNRIVNIHPSLLPNYGGKGMYGEKVHQAVLANGDEKSGISVHFVNEVYDQGAIIMQAEVDVNKEDTVESLSQKIHQLEHEYYPKVVLSLATDLAAKL